MARTIDRDRHHLTDVLRAAAVHEGAALVEIYQNCPVFNDGAFGALTEKGVKDANQIRLEHGQPIRFGHEHERGVARLDDGGLGIVDVSVVGEEKLLIHDSHRPDPGLAFSLARLAEDPTRPDADRDLPRRRASRVRAAARGPEPRAPRSSSPSCWSAAIPGPSISRSGSPRDQNRTLARPSALG